MVVGRGGGVSVGPGQAGTDPEVPLPTQGVASRHGRGQRGGVSHRPVRQEARLDGQVGGGVEAREGREAAVGGVGRRRGRRKARGAGGLKVGVGGGRQGGGGGERDVAEEVRGGVVRGLDVGGQGHAAVGDHALLPLGTCIKPVRIHMYIVTKWRKIKEKQQISFKNPNFSVQLPSSGVYFLQVNVGKNSSHNES